MTATPQQQWIGSSKTPPRTLSPMLTRAEEKDQLSYLNDKLTVWKDKSSTIRQQNEDLRRQLEEARAVSAREQDGMRNMYEQELADARRLLDETAKEKAKNQITATKNAALANDLREKLASETEAREKADGAARSAEQALVRKEGELQNAQQETSALEKALHDSEKVCADVRKALDKARNDLEAETVNRVDVENNLQSLKEDLSFKGQLFDQEKAELISRLDALQRSRDELKAHFDEQLEKRVLVALADAREQHEDELEQLTEELGRQHDEQVRQLQDRQNRDRQLLDKVMAENRDMRDQSQNLKAENAAALAKKGELEKRLDDLRKSLEEERDNHAAEKERLQNELAAATDELEENRKSFADLLEANVKLDKEIEKYAKLMEEELPLSKSPAETDSGAPASARGRKRRRPDLPEETDGSIIISEVDPDGNYVTLSNTSSVNQSFAHWHLRHEVPGQEAVDFKFPARFILKGQSHVTVWAAGSGHSHHPPRDLLFKQKQSWGTADRNSALVLVDASGAVKTKLTAPSAESPVSGGDSPDSGPPLSSSQEDIFHQQGDPHRGSDRQGCIIC